MRPFARTLLCLLCLILVLTGCGTAPASPPASEATPSPTATGMIVLADISDEPTERIEAYQPLADYLASHLGEFGIGVGEVKIAPDLATLTEWMKTGEVDLYFDSPYPAMIISDQAGGVPILRRWRSGVESYHSVFFARADSGLDTIEDLAGQVVAFEEDFSTSGYMLPKVHLIEAGFKPVEKGSEAATVSPEEVGYLFSGDDDTTIQWVISGRTVAGVTDSQSFAEIPAETRDQLVVLAETESVPRQVVVIRPNMDPALQQAITDLLLGLDETEEGRAILLAFQETTRFDEFPEGADAALDRMRDLYRLTQSE